MKKVAIQGIAGSFHEEAAKKFFKDEEVQIVECRTFRKVCQLIDTDEVDLGVMAIENAIAGSLIENYGLISDFHMKVIGEVYVHIRMNLMALPGVSKDQIQEIHSHPIALKQCAEYIVREFGEISLDDNFDTAGAAKNIIKNHLQGVASIGNERTAELYGLNILDKGVETNTKNYTRFLLLSKHGCEQKENNKASICFEVGHYCGSLAQVLDIFAAHSVNLTKIQSVPIIGKPQDYAFHVDVEWENIENYEQAIHQILKCVSRLSILGEYVRGERNMHDQK